MNIEYSLRPPDSSPAHDADPGFRADNVVVRVRHLSKNYQRRDGSNVPANDNVSIDVHSSEFVVLLGPSGCGKTTLLRSIGGLDRPDFGEIELRGTTVFSSSRRINVAPENRRISMIFQSYALWPHLTTFENVAYPLRARREPKKLIVERVGRVLQQVGIDELETQYPGQMSGGQQQRVALARAIVANDDLVLLDEPLSNVDAKVREQVRLEILRMQREFGFAAVHVTHDQVEAMELAHRIAVMRNGRIEQLGAPREVYDRPSTRYVANFVGRANEVEGVLSSCHADAWLIDSPGGQVVAGNAGPGLVLGESAVAICRPERCQISFDEPMGPNRWLGIVEASLFAGGQTEHFVRVGESVFKVTSQHFDEGLNAAQVWISVDPRYVRALPAKEPLDPPGPGRSVNHAADG